MESASPEHSSEQPPGHIANLIGVLITTLTLTLPLYAISNFKAIEVEIPQQSQTLSMKAKE
ncbi:hypothetical protein [cf. Phormidesmis sp. LEGE 11477]|uniref:hypothetical protein n=1 Tax=cf. Phormidesmis sp. LEGE 11477 TaxID=1828680 RepID=UPI0018814DB8|nr:hypothetical protein [cf. Phormidesmis sp. LEGE 11477]MBE9063596.1 hypothetical protein [cf. Phormidesmis sp. LEGE 11477]